jgi:hypothetical protein
MKLFVRITAVYLGLIGLASLCDPAASSQLGHTLSMFDVFMARSLGAALVTVALIDWSASSRLRSLGSGLLWANLFMNTALAAIDIGAIAHKTIGSGAWFGVGMHCVFIAGLVYWLMRQKKQKLPSATKSA